MKYSNHGKEFTDGKYISISRYRFLNEDPRSAINTILCADLRKFTVGLRFCLRTQRWADCVSIIGRSNEQAYALSLVPKTDAHNFYRPMPKTFIKLLHFMKIYVKIYNGLLCNGEKRCGYG